MTTRDDEILQVNVNEKATDDFMRYATAVIKSRAVSDADDNLKPVHRRILYAMREMKLDSKAKTIKSAKVVGAVMGAYHPHGDASIYDALVRLSQPWKMRYPLTFIQGNNGSLTGDQAAASRYTECRLAPAGEWILKGTDPDIVPFTANYDNTTIEPVVLPSIFPNILCNGNEGIAVGMSSKMVPHNYKEVSNAIRAMLHNPEMSTTEVMQYISGPDFPLGGIIVNGGNLKDIYNTGHGSIILRARAVIDRLANTITFSGFPYLVDVETRIIKAIKEMVNDGYDAIDNVETHIGKNSQHITVVLDKKANPDKVVRDLYDKTPLEKTISINYLVIKNGVPVVMGLTALLRNYIEHQHQLITKMAIKKRNENEHIKHIQEGLRLATLNIDQVIGIVRNADDKNAARVQLIATLNIDVEQANAILALQLGRLTKLDKHEIEEKINNAIKVIAECTNLIENKDARIPVIEKNLDEMDKIFTDERRTEIMYTSKEEEADEKAQSVVPVIATLLNDGRIANVPIASFCDVWKRGGALAKYTPLSWVFTDGFKPYVLMSDGTTSNTYLKNNSSTHLFLDNPKKNNIVTISKNGIIKRSWRSDYNNVKKLCKVKAEDALNWAFCCDDDEVLFVRCKDKAKLFPIKDLKIMGKLTMGNKLLGGLIPDDVFVANVDSLFYTVNDKGQTKVCKVSEIGESWVNITPNTQHCGLVHDNMFYCDGGKYKEIKWDEYSLKGKTSVGAILGKEISILN